MKLKKTLLAGVSVFAGAAAVIGALKLKKYLDREEILVKETDLFTHIDLNETDLPADLFVAIKNKDFSIFSIVVDKSANTKFLEMELEIEYNAPAWNDSDTEIFYIYDSSNLSSDFEDDSNIFEEEALI